MALNPQLVQTAQAYGGPSIPFPVCYQNEMIFSSRDQSAFKIDGPREYKFSGSGTVFLTNYRIIFVPKKPTPTIQAIEIPLALVSDENVSQPIFGANNMHGQVTPVDAPPNSSERIKWKLSFTNGGMGTMVPLFYATLEYLRTSMRRAHQNANDEPPAPPKEVPSFVQSALVDPSDPTKIYLTSPVDPAFQNPEKYPLL